MARILMADDDEDMIEICSRLLPRRGHTLTTASNAADAVRLAGELQPDLILMDMRMPVSSTGDVSDRAGLDAVLAIKAKPELKATPIIALTGHMMTMFRAAIIEAGCVDMLAKPIENFAHLTDSIEMALKKAAQA
jgi:two-component system cell cycle response regulator DivK